jgi:DNA-binding CsgD family transcriptional regulator
LVGAIRRGESRSLVLRGEAGIGKTALLEYLVGSASDLTVVRGVGVESEMELAFASLHQLCGPLLDQRARLPAPQRRALETVFGLSDGAAPDRFLVGLGVLSLCSEAADQRPLLCVVDDAQWLDQASALTLAFVARRLLAEPVGIVFAARDPGEALQHITELDVRGLRDDDARALLSSAVGFNLDERVRDRIVAETRGNPLALLELPRGLSAAQLAGGFGTVGTQALSGQIEESFLRRLEALPDDARRLLLIAAAEPVGDALLLWAAAERLGIAATSAADAVKANGLLTVGERVTFHHPLVRSGVYRSASAEERREVHRALAEATDAQADPDRRAWHLAAAAARPDEDVAVELERSAGRAQARGGLAAAAAFLQRAVELTADPTRRVDRALAAAEASLQAGAFDDARRLLTAAEIGPVDEFQQAGVELLRGHIAMLSTFGSDALPLLLKAARRLERLDVNIARDTYLDAWGAALLAARLGTRGGLREVSHAARSAPPADGAPRPSDLLLDSLATVVTDGRAAAAPLLEDATRTFSDEQFPAETTLHWGWMTVVPTYALWDEQSNYEICVRQLDAVRKAGGLARLPLDLASFSLLAVRCGDFASAEEAIAEADALTTATGTGITSRAASLDVFRGHEEEARASIDSTRRQAFGLGQGMAVEISDWLFAVLSNSLGRYDDVVTAARDSSNDEPEEPFVSAWTAMEVLEAATRSDAPEMARGALERIVAATAAGGTDTAVGLLARSRALVSTGAEAERLYEEAIARLERSRLRPELARAHLLYGEWLRRENRRVDARAELRAAHDQFTEMGMEGFAARANRELVATGAKARKRTVETRDELTAQERQIARLARDGLSNPEIGARLFLSRRTVEWHLGKVFTKLGIRSRAQLSGALPSSESELAPA